MIISFTLVFSRWIRLQVTDAIHATWIVFHHCLWQCLPVTKPDKMNDTSCKRPRLPLPPRLPGCLEGSYVAITEIVFGYKLYKITQNIIIIRLPLPISRLADVRELYWRRLFLSQIVFFSIIRIGVVIIRSTLRYKTTKNSDVSTGPLVRPLSCSHSSLIRFLCIVRFARSLCCAQSFAHSLQSPRESKYLDVSKRPGFVPQCSRVSHQRSFRRTSYWGRCRSLHFTRKWRKTAPGADGKETTMRGAGGMVAAGGLSCGNGYLWVSLVVFLYVWLIGRNGSGNRRRREVDIPVNLIIWTWT